VNLTTPEIVIIAVAVVAVLLIATTFVLYARRKRRRDELKQRHGGAEYTRTVERTGSARRAEEHLSEREKRRATFDIRDLSSGERATFRGRFEAIEASFVVGPEPAVRAADSLLDEVAECRGYPDADPERRLDDLSCDHAAAVDRYRKTRTRPDPDGGSTTTEQHRLALLGSRVLFDAVVGRNAAERVGAPRTFRDLVRDDDHEHLGNGHRRHEPSRN
jgi:hypothetical protein